MRNFLRRLEQKPTHQKQAIALGVSTTVTLVIFMFWLSHFFASIGASQVVVTKEDVEMAKTTSPVSPFESIKKGVAGIGESVADLGEIFGGPLPAPESVGTSSEASSVPPKTPVVTLSSTTPETPEDIPVLPPPEESQ